MTDNRNNVSVLGRLLEELSWAGSTVRNYREGGKGYENVLTAEAFLGLDFLPRSSFLGPIIERAHGAEKALSILASEIELAKLTLLPGNHYLKPSGVQHQYQLAVQPDGLIESPHTFTILEAKRIKRSFFKPEQLAREYVLALRDAAGRQPILLLVLGAPPPIPVRSAGKVAIPDAIQKYLASVIEESEEHNLDTARAMDSIHDCVCWITW